MADTLNFDTLLGSALTTSTNPDPNTLATTNPYPDPFTNFTDVSSAWTAQGAKALFPRYTSVVEKFKNRKVWLHFVPVGPSVTYTIRVWFYNRTTDTWVSPKLNGTQSYTGEMVDFIDNVPHNPIFMEIDTLSTGTLSIYYDSILTEAH